MRNRLRRRPDPLAQRLAELGLPAAGDLGRVGTAFDLPAGTTLVREGERGSQAFLLVRGTAQVLAADGVVTVGPGAVVGEQATLDPHRTRNATVIAGTDVTVLVYDRATFRSLADLDALRPHLAPAR